MGIYSIKPKFQKVLAPIQNWCITNNISPTTLNVAGLISAYLMVVCIVGAVYMPWLLLVLPPLALIRTAFNALDGLVSRAQGIDSKYGQFLNETVDRVSDAAIFLAFLLVPDVLTTLVAVTVSLILLNSYIAIVTQAAGGPRLYNGIVGKADRMIYLSVAAVAVYWTQLFYIFDYFLMFIIIGTAISIVQRLVKARIELGSTE